ncbi:MAG: HAMP domain-containing protein [Ignavibacteria bacterium]|nr:HAMP domain-containing protein [Ignavibacteria bacterium]
MNISLRNRIALFYLSATSVITLLLFVVIYQVVYNTSFKNLDERLEFEALDILDDIDMNLDTVYFIDESEWSEKEHSDVEVYPIFAEVTNIEKKSVIKTPNLKSNSLSITPGITENFNSRLSEKQIRQLQRPILNKKGKLIGYIIIAIPVEGAINVINSLKNVLFISYPVLLLILFLISRYIAGKSITPLIKINEEAQKITKESLGTRIDLPKNKDEIHELAGTINGLMNRLEDAVLREKQFTADASHELRTPLSVIKGTLEVLIRKPRDVSQYQNKIQYCIKEVDRIGVLIDQLLMLARFESQEVHSNEIEIELNQSVQYCIHRLSEYAADKGIVINFYEKNKYFVCADPSLIDIILENLLSNAIKYSNESKQIDITLNETKNEVTCSIKDYGIGMSPEQIKRVFDRFYRTDEARSTEAGGHGIGMAIVKRLADLQKIKVSFSSEILKGTKVSLTFSKKKTNKPLFLQ